MRKSAQPECREGGRECCAGWQTELLRGGADGAVAWGGRRGCGAPARGRTGQGRGQTGQLREGADGAGAWGGGRGCCAGRPGPTGLLHGEADGAAAQGDG